MVVEVGSDKMAANPDYTAQLSECDCDINRVKKLKETLLAVQQLDKNMSGLRSWLGHIETELTRPIVYEACDFSEIQCKLNQQQELQRDIEKHSAGVSSVLNLCEVLLHDCDACATETECESIQQATRSLDRRWRNICAVAMETRLKIEETWRLWQKFLDDFGRFEDWLKAAERTAAHPNSSGVLYTCAKEELKKFEAFQRQVQESLTQLELINKQYRRLARENRTDSLGRLREMVHDGNFRWDNLQRRVASILRRLKHTIGQREEFETNRDSVLVWLTEMDLQLTNIEHFSECDAHAKIKQLRAFQQEMSLNAAKMAYVFEQGEALLGASEPLDAAVVEEELEELRRYCKEVFGRVERYYRRLTRLLIFEDDFESSDREIEPEETGDLSLLQWDEAKSYPLSGHAPDGPICSPAEACGRDTPASVDSIPLEWDHDYDLEPMGDSSGARETGSAVSTNRQEREEQVAKENTWIMGDSSPLSDVVIPESPEAYIQITKDNLRSSPGELLLAQQKQTSDPAGVTDPPSLSPEGDMCRQESNSPDIDSPCIGYMRLMGETRRKRKEDEFSRLTNIGVSEIQSSGVMKGLETLETNSKLKQWHHISSELDSLDAWLRKMEGALNKLKGRDLTSSIYIIQEKIRKLKELQKGVEARKPNVLSINLTSMELIQTGCPVDEGVERRIREMKRNWEQLSSSLQDTQGQLLQALVQCQEFYQESHSLLLWLEDMDGRRNEVIPIASGLDLNTLRSHYGTLMALKSELSTAEPRIETLEELSQKLLQGKTQEATEYVELEERVHVIRNRKHTLFRAVISDLQQLEAEIEATLALQTRETIHKSVSHACTRLTRGSACGHSASKVKQVAVRSCHQPFFLRVLQAAFPLQLLLLLLLGLTCLVPTTQEDFNCHHANNFARSFHPMLHYTNGPPPI